MLTLIAEGGRNAHPANWAPFVVVGEGASLEILLHRVIPELAPTPRSRHCSDSACYRRYFCRAGESSRRINLARRITTGPNIASGYVFQCISGVAATHPMPSVALVGYRASA